MLTSLAVAIFHVSFHPTKGNIVDWSVTTDGACFYGPILLLLTPRPADSVSLDNVEFSALPSGLHQRDEDVMCAACLVLVGLLTRI